MPGVRTRRTKVLAAGLATAAVAATAAVVGSPASAATTFTATADAYVESTSPSTNFGTAPKIRVDNDPVARTFLKFTVTGLTQPVTRAVLRIRTTSKGGSDTGGVWRPITDTSWSETGVTWDNQPAIDGTRKATLGPVTKNKWYAIDVTSVVTGNGTYAFAGSSPSTDGAGFNSRESADGPQLVINAGTAPTPAPRPPQGGPVIVKVGDPVLVGAGDIATSGPGAKATAALLDRIPGTVFTAGDNVYVNGTLGEFTKYYLPTWGRHLARTKPAPGNHDYNTSGATGYYRFFGALAGDPLLGYYSYDLGDWHVLALNSNIARGAGSAQEKWLRADLAASTKPCTVAYWHHPRFTSGAGHPPDRSVAALVQALYDYNAEIVIAGHDHNYERFAPQNPSGQADPARGIRHFVVGTGGASHSGFTTPIPNSEVRNGNTFGVLKLTLHTNGYDWQFVPEAGRSFTDSGQGTCH
jgi:hypothetical protein